MTLSLSLDWGRGITDLHCEIGNLLSPSLLPLPLTRFQFPNSLITAISSDREGQTHTHTRKGKEIGRYTNKNTVRHFVAMPKSRVVSHNVTARVAFPCFPSPLGAQRGYTTAIAFAAH